MASAPQIFLSYSHDDESWKDRLVDQLRVLVPDGLLSPWEDRQIAAGADRLPEIETALGSCTAAILLISARFLTSGFILRTEVPRLLQRREQEGLLVIPLILQPCPWPRVGWLKTIQAHPKDGKPLSSMSKNKADAALAALAGEIADRLSHSTGVASTRRARPSAILPPRVDLTKLPFGAADFLGREAELRLLDDAWSDPGTVAMELIAPGGVGKTALVKRWLDRLRADGWRGAARVYGWSFGSQGSGNDRQASDDSFLSAALGWFGVDHDPAISPWDKGKLLAQAVAADPTLLVLDGVEPLQHPPGPMAGRLRAPGLQALLAQLATGGQPGLCILATRERIQDLAEYERRSDRPGGAVARHDLGNLSDTDGARLLHRLGVRRAGSAPILDDDAELIAAAREVRRHALTLTLLGGFLAQAHGGDCLRRDVVDLAEADESQGGHAFRVMAAYETWFERAGEQGARELAALRLLGFFDRPADAGCLDALRQAPPIPGLTEPLVHLGSARWSLTLSRLRDGGLIEPIPADWTEPDSSPIDAHPLVRDYLAAGLRRLKPDAWREGHRRLYEYLKASVPYRPEGLAALQPLYQAVRHGCLAGLQQETRAEIFFDRILRNVGVGVGVSDFSAPFHPTAGDGYSTNDLGAFGVDLGAVACFFETPWQQVCPVFSEAEQNWLLSAAAYRLRALGRLAEALEAAREGARRAARSEQWWRAADCAHQISELNLSLGQVTESVHDAERSVSYAERHGGTFWRIVCRAMLANALHQQGARDTARRYFQEAEAIQPEREPNRPLLWSLAGFSYCDFLLDDFDPVAWMAFRSNSNASGSVLAQIQEVKERATRISLWGTYAGARALTMALDRLTLGRIALLQAVLTPSESGTGRPLLDQAAKELNAAVGGLRAAGQQHYLPRGLIPRAWLHALQNNPAAARVDLDEAWQIASRGGMRLFMADIHLHRARLFRDRSELAKARALIERCGYWRRRAELEDTETAALEWPE